MKYKPYLIQRINVGFSQHDKGCGAICDYDYMGSSEFEWGAIPASIKRVRERIADYVIKEIKLAVPVDMAGSGEIAHSIYALLRRERLNEYEDFEKTVNDLVEDKIRTKEYTGFKRDFDLWQDIDADLYFSYSLPYLRLIHSICSRPYEYAQQVQTQLAIGDEIEMAVVLNGTAIRHVRSMRVRSGKVAGLLESHVVMKDHGKKFKMPYVFILSHQIEIV